MTHDIKRLTVPLVMGLLLLLAPAHAEAATQHVAMENYAYSPSSLTIRVGDTVVWTNHDQAPHDVVTTSGPVSLQSPLLATGESWSFTFTVAGTYSYYCSVHPDMRAQVVVQPAETQAPAPAPVPVQTAAPAPTTTEAAAPPPAPATVPTTTVTPAQAQASMATEETLDPMLLVAGLVAGVTILCLLLMNARPEP
jgi:plastocyanin